jgi:hypothetical protein
LLKFFLEVFLNFHYETVASLLMWGVREGAHKPATAWKGGRKRKREREEKIGPRS